ncbi:glutaredoxin family protein [Calidithermus roseus]|uniref:Mycoredoxin 1 n=1 Tax=Calidithermus roseus TaxID=1644118 RepID=A0A399F1L7_9DEIN|nr:glutaredoxin family protein [Calidithermus roseus]RIH89586.1 Mycoredoxin 1 [Calidithermus roseus]
MARVLVYGTEWCPLTLGFRKYLQQSGIPFELHDVERDPEAEQAVRAMNGGKLKFPMVAVGELEGHWKPGDDARTLKNPRLAELQEALQRYGFTIS